MKMYPRDDALVLELTPREALAMIERLSMGIGDALILGGAGVPFEVDATDGGRTTRANFIIQVTG